MLYCPQCGCDCEELVEGYCRDCQKENQAALDLHNTKYDWWQRLTPNERELAIRWAIR